MSQKPDKMSHGKIATDASQNAASSVNDRYARKHLKPIAKSVY